MVGTSLIFGFLLPPSHCFIYIFLALALLPHPAPYMTRTDLEHLM
ncbi:hypothetical protein SSAG_02998 [Streptomyces sp. Mg1]|nr:hypothetical protein SSAG_02998 [Streptomyces sp. Mg1]